MIAPHEADDQAEAAIVAYVQACIPDPTERTPENLRRILEMLQSKAAHGIRRFCGPTVAVEVAMRTLANVGGLLQRDTDNTGRPLQ